MSPDRHMDADSLRRQVHGHLLSLAQAGVEWLPIGAPMAPDERVAESAVRVQEGLFVEAGTAPALVTPADLETRRQALKVLVEEVAGCTRCAELASTRTQTVFGQGQAGVELCFIGEAPGADEDAQGLPFVGAAGQLLNKIIAACGLK